MKLAILQMTSGIDPAENRDILVSAIEEAAAGGAEILFTPEMTGLLDRNRERLTETISDEDNDIVLRAACSAAQQHRIRVALGSLALAPNGVDAKWANRSFLIDEKGSIAARYDKIHLFDVDLKDGPTWQESAFYAPGDRPVVAQLLHAKLGLSVCYDLRFPELYRSLVKGGASIIAIPAAFTAQTGKVHWEVLLRARAIESQAFVVAAAQYGKHQDGRETWGHSMVVDPWGMVLLDMGEGSGVGFCDIDLDRVEDVRAQIPSLVNAREIGQVAAS